MATLAKTEQIEPSPESGPVAGPVATAPRKASRAVAGLVVDVVLAGLALGLAAWVLTGESPRLIVDQSVAVIPTVSVKDAALTVRLGPDNRLALGNEEMDEASLVGRLLQGGQPPATVALVVSGDALYANVAAAVGLLRRAGIRDLQLSVAP
jgi:biopolymer transport protein ExbD